MSYQVPAHINQNKIFFVNRSELEERFDTQMAIYNRETSSYAFPVYKLSKLIIGELQYGANEEGVIRENINTPRYIRITDIDNNGILIDSIGVTVNNVEDKYILNHDDILFARSGATVGKTYLHKDVLPYTCVFAGYMIRVIVNREMVLPEYVFVFTQLSQYKKWVKFIQRASAQPNINAEEYKSLKLPLPPMAVQKTIVDIYYNATELKQKRESMAQVLIDNINVYLLRILGIDPSLQNYLIESSNTNKQESNKAGREQTTYLTSLKIITGNRFDPYYNHPNFVREFDKLCQSQYPLMRLKDIAESITSGTTPKSGGNAYCEKEDGIAFIRSGDIDIDGNIDFDDLLYIKPEIHYKKMKSSQVVNNDIMIAIVGATIGQVGIYHSDKEANINQAIALVRLKEGYNPEFVKEVIKSSIGQLNLNRLKRPVARANINLEEISSILIPVPQSRTIQDEIVKHITDIRKQAQSLKDEGKALVEEAKRKVEQILLGETGNLY